jgi:Ca2+-dependent lipid-binding protein
MASRTTVRTNHPTQPHTRILGIGSSRDPYSPPEAPLVILRVQVISCDNLVARDRNGSSDPFVVVSILGKEFKTPVCKRNLNPIYPPEYATFEFPIYTSLVERLGTLNLKFVVWDKDMFGKDFLGKNALPVNEWFKETAFAFNDPRNQPIHVGLLSSRTTTILHGSICIKVGFVHPPNQTIPVDYYWNVYNTLANRVLPLGPQADHVGIVTLLIWGARDLPEWPTVTRIGWDMDPYLKVTIGDESQSTQVIRHDLKPVWNKQLVFHVRERDLSLPIVLSVYDWDRFSFDDHVGDVKIHISQLVGSTSKKDRAAGFYSDSLPTMSEFTNVPFVTLNPTRPYKITPALTFRAGYQSYDELRQQVGH